MAMARVKLAWPAAAVADALTVRRLLFLLVAATAASAPPSRVYEPDLLEPVFLMAALNAEGDRYGPPMHSMVSTVGVVRVDMLENPKVPSCWPHDSQRQERVCTGPPEVAHTSDDVLTVLPSELHSAVATCQIDLWEENFGPNRLQIFVKISGEVCTARSSTNASNFTRMWRECEPGYDRPGSVLRGWLARHNSPHSAVKNLTMRTLGHHRLNVRVGEWLEVGADFDLLPSKYGAGGDRLALYVQLGDAAAQHGRAHMTGVRLSAILKGRTNEVENVAWLKPLTGAPAPTDSSQPRAQDVLTNGVFNADAGQTWFMIVGLDEELAMEIKLYDDYYLCSADVRFVYSSKVYQWNLDLYSSEISQWVPALAIDELEELRVVEAAGNVWRPPQLERYFNSCQAATKIRLTLLKTKNFNYAMTEVAVYGYKASEKSPCELECRHGGTCKYSADAKCTCVERWGWRGLTCAHDVDECTLEPGSETALELGIGEVNGGCGTGGDATASNCTNSDGGWSCSCHVGFSGDAFEVRGERGWRAAGQGNECSNVDECKVNGGHCDHICVDQVGAYGRNTHVCSCRNGFVLSNDDTTCLPYCSRPCRPPSVCIAPEKCEVCAHGWMGPYCDEAMCDNEIEYLDSRGQLVIAKGCYHGGTCSAANLCVDCQGGWTGKDCAASPGAGYSLALAVLSVMLTGPTLWVVIHKRNWVALQERGVMLMVLSNIGCTIWVVALQLSAFPHLAGIVLSAHTVEPDHPVSGVWLPFTLGYALWFNALLVRGRNLLIIHLRGSVPFHLIFQLPVLFIPYVLVSFLRGQIGYLAWVLVIAASLVYLAKTYRQLWILRADLDDVVVNLLMGALAALCMLVFMMLRATGKSYLNPDGGIQVLFAALFTLIGTAHIGMSQSLLLWRLHQADSSDAVDKYARGSESDTDDEAKEESGRGSRWLKALRKSKGLVLAKIGPETITPAQHGDTNATNADTAATTADDSASDDSSSSEYATSSSETSAESSSEEQEDSTTDAAESPQKDHPNGLAQKGSGRGGGGGLPPLGVGRASRGRGWNRSSRGRAHGRARGRIRLPALQGASPAVARAKEAPTRPVAELFRAVEKKALPEAESLSDSDSSDSELEDLRREVRKFEKLVERKSRPVKAGGPGKVPVFRGKTWGESRGGTGSSLDSFGLPMQLQKNIFDKRDALWAGDEPNKYSRASAVDRPASAPTTRLSTTAVRVAGSGPATSKSLLGELPALKGAEKYLSHTLREAPSPSKTSTAGKQLLGSPQRPSTVRPDHAVSDWLNSLRLEEWQPKLFDFGVQSLDDLAEICDDDLSGMGMKRLQRRRFFEAVGQVLSPHSQSHGASQRKVRPASAPTMRATDELVPTVDSTTEDTAYEGRRAGDSVQQWQGSESSSDGDDDVDAMFSVEDVTYRVTIFTGSAEDAGTDAKVWIELHGECGSTDRVFLPRWGSAEDRTTTSMPFVKAGGRAEFQLEWPHLHDLTLLRIGHDISDSDANATWLCDRVEVALRGEKWLFPCNEWLDTDRGLSRELSPVFLQ